MGKCNIVRRYTLRNMNDICNLKFSDFLKEEWG